MIYGMYVFITILGTGSVVGGLTDYPTQSWAGPPDSSPAKAGHWLGKAALQVKRMPDLRFLLGGSHGSDRKRWIGQRTRVAGLNTLRIRRFRSLS
jgi:hypothetical protein